MDLDKQLEKYWNAEMPSREEQQLYDAAQQTDRITTEEKEYLQSLQQFQQLKKPRQLTMEDLQTPAYQSLSVASKANVFKYLVRVAAVALVAFSLYFLMQPAHPIPTSSHSLASLTAEEKAAYETTRQALLLVSSKLNKGTDLTASALNQLEKTQQKILLKPES